MSTVVQTHVNVALQALSEPLIATDPNVEQQTYWLEGRRQLENSIPVREVEAVSVDERAFPRSRPRADSHTSRKVPCVMPSTQTALVVTADRTYRLESDFPAPQELGDDEVIIRNRAVGLNHIDWKSVDYNFCLPTLPWITGREMAGVIECVGSNVTKVKRGDFVWTCKCRLLAVPKTTAQELTTIKATYYKDRRAGCFQELVAVPYHTVFPIPTGLDFTAAACLGVGGLTAAMSLWRWLGVPMHPGSSPVIDKSTPDAKPKDILLIWGGSTITGQFATQIAAHAGLDIIAVCSQSTAALVSRLGATFVVTYTSKTSSQIVEEIVSLAGDRLTKAIDLVGANTARLVLQVIEACNKPVDFAPLAFTSSKDPIPSNAIIQTVEMKQFVLDRESEKYGVELNDMIERRVLKIPEVRIIQGGLSSVEEGLSRLKGGDLMGEKLIVAIS